MALFFLHLFPDKVLHHIFNHAILSVFNYNSDSSYFLRQLLFGLLF